jgi:hypothetical protein
MVSVLQTFGDRVNPHPHVHALVSRGGWTRDERFLPIPYVDPHVAQGLFRQKVFAFLLRKELISHERIELLTSWRHSGFSVHNAVTLAPSDHQAVEALTRYMMRPPVSLARLKLLPGEHEVLHFPKGSGDDPGSAKPERIDALDYVARVLAQIPPPRKHLVRYHGFYSNAARGKRRQAIAEVSTTVEYADQPEAPAPVARAARKRWADLLRRVYEVDPLVCPRCASTMRVVGFITQPHVIRRILDHLRQSQTHRPRPPPGVRRQPSPAL